MNTCNLKKIGIKMTLISYLKMKNFYRNINTIFNTTSITEYKKIVIALSVLISYYTTCIKLDYEQTLHIQAIALPFKKTDVPINHKIQNFINKKSSPSYVITIRVDLFG